MSHPIRSLAQAYVYYSQCTPFGIYEGDTMAGYVMVIYDWDEECYNIRHMMIDAPLQHRGIGRAALIKVLEYIKSKPFGSSDTVILTCSPENTAAYALYESLGFKKTDGGDDEEDEMKLVIS